jgi:enamine deaminase RidA (YjgF/YER057c/UK114 family)
MEKSVINSVHLQGAYPRKPGERLPSALRIWPRVSAGIRTANFIFAGGTAGVNRDGQVVAPDDGRLQIGAALERLREVVEAGGAPFSDVFKLRWFLTSEADREPVTRGVMDYLARHGDANNWPVLSQVVAESSSGVIRAEIEAFAATSHRSIRCPDLYSHVVPGEGSASYAHATWVGNLLFTAGILPFDIDGAVVSQDPEAQATFVLESLTRILAAAGVTPGDLVKLTVWIDRAADRDALSRACASYLSHAIAGGVYPALAMLIAPLGHGAARVQVEAVAARGERIPVQSEHVSSAMPCAVPHSQALKVPLVSEVGSYLRRFSWPRAISAEDRQHMGGALECHHPLGHLVFFSSQAGVDGTGRLSDRSMGGQATRVFENLRALAEAAGGRFSDIIQFDIYYAHQELYHDYNESRVRFLESNVPDKDWFAGSGVRAGSTIEGALIEIEAIAAITAPG